MRTLTSEPVHRFIGSLIDHLVGAPVNQAHDFRGKISQNSLPQLTIFERFGSKISQKSLSQLMIFDHFGSKTSQNSLPQLMIFGDLGSKNSRNSLPQVMIFDLTYTFGFPDGRGGKV